MSDSSNGAGTPTHDIDEDTDTAYSPSSERETEASQTEQRDADDLRADGIDPEKVIAAPGTGGADDAGDVEPEPGDLRLPWQSEEDRQG